MKWPQWNWLKLFFMWFWFSYDLHVKNRTLGNIKRIVKIKSWRTFLVDGYGGSRMTVTKLPFDKETFKWMLWKRWWNKYYN